MVTSRYYTVGSANSGGRIFRRTEKRLKIFVRVTYKEIHKAGENTIRLPCASLL